MSSARKIIRVFYDQACPSCRKDRVFYEGLTQSNQESVEWIDANDPSACLIDKGIEPRQALLKLFIEIENEDGSKEILSELDAYIVLMQRTRLLKPLSILIGLPVIRPILSWLYKTWVRNRLKKQGRL